MAKTANINMRVEAKTKERAEELFRSFGISITDAINIFLNTSIMNGGFPFKIVQPRFNKETELAMEEARNIAIGNIERKAYSTAKELIEDIEK